MDESSLRLFVVTIFGGGLYPVVEFLSADDDINNSNVTKQLVVYSALPQSRLLP